MNEITVNGVLDPARLRGDPDYVAFAIRAGLIARPRFQQVLLEYNDEIGVMMDRVSDEAREVMEGYRRLALRFTLAGTVVGAINMVIMVMWLTRLWP